MWSSHQNCVSKTFLLLSIHNQRLLTITNHYKPRSKWANQSMSSSHLNCVSKASELPFYCSSTRRIFPKCQKPRKVDVGGGANAGRQNCSTFVVAYSSAWRKQGLSCCWFKGQRTFCNICKTPKSTKFDMNLFEDQDIKMTQISYAIALSI